MLESIIKSKTRKKLLIKFFVNIANTGYLNDLASEFSESTNSVRKELNNLTEANYLTKRKIDNKVVYQANQQHPLYDDIARIVKKYLGIETLINTVLDNIGVVKEIYLLSDYANGFDSGQIDVLIVANNINYTYVKKIERKLANLLNRKIVIVISNNNSLNVKKLLIFKS